MTIPDSRGSDTPEIRGMVLRGNRGGHPKAVFAALEPEFKQDDLAELQDIAFQRVREEIEALTQAREVKIAALDQLQS